MAYIKKIWKDYPDTTTQIKADYLNNIENGIEAVDAGLENIENGIENIETGISNGWVSAGETWEYASVDDPTGVITISGDVTTKYSLGMKIKFTNNSNIIYGIITAISYTSPNTTLTFLHEINPSNSQALHIMTNSAISNSYYSMLKAPFGFPMDPNKWTIYSTGGTTSKSNPSANVYYNIGGSLTLGVGLYELSYDIMGYNDGNTTGFLSFQCGWGTTTSNQDIANSKGWVFANNTIMIGAVHNKIIYEVTSPQTLYLNACTIYANTLTLQTWNYGVRRKAVCGYL